MIPEIKYKQYVIIPKKPKMSKGKIASQVAHATYMALEKQMNLEKKLKNNSGELIELITRTKEYNLITEWKVNGMCVIVLQCKDTVQLMGIAKYLEQWKIPNHLYIDEGITEVSMGTPTALATGVLPEDHHWMLSTLRLFK